MYDRGTDLISVQPLKSKEAVSMRKAIKAFKGRRKVENAYTDNCKSMIDAMVAEGINYDLSEPGIPESNGMMESMVKIILNAARTKLEAGGAPVCFIFLRRNITAWLATLYMEHGSV